MKHSERGVVLLTTLLVMTLMATIAATLMDDVGFGVKRAVNVDANAQTLWYTRAAEDFAGISLERQLRGAAASQINQAMRRSAPQVLPIEGGVITLTVRDGSHCFGLNALATAPGQNQFASLLQALGLDARQAATLASAAADWRDADSEALQNGAEDYVYLGLSVPYRTANTDFRSVMELRSLTGVSETLYQRLRPFVCARQGEGGFSVNINTLRPEQAPLLAAVLGHQNFDVALKLISERPGGGYDTLEALQAAPALLGVDTAQVDFSAISFEPDFLWVEADIRHRSARRTVVMEFARSGNSVQRTYRSYSQEALRPDAASAQGYERELTRTAI